MKRNAPTPHSTKDMGVSPSSKKHTPFMKSALAPHVASALCKCLVYAWVLSWATNRRSGLMLSNSTPKYIVATYERRNS